MVTYTGHIGIYEGVDGRTYVRTDVHDVMAMKPNFLTSMGYHIFLSMVLRRARSSATIYLKYQVDSFKLVYEFSTRNIPEPAFELIVLDFQDYLPDVNDKT